LIEFSLKCLTKIGVKYRSKSNFNPHADNGLHSNVGILTFSQRPRHPWPLAYYI